MVEAVNCFHIHLVLPARYLLKNGRVRHGQLLALLGAHYVDREAWVANRGQKCVQLEVTDVLGTRGHNVRRVQVVPDVGNFADGDPVVAFVCDEALLKRQVVVVDIWRANWCRRYIPNLLQRFWKHLYWIVAIIGNICWLITHLCVLSAEQLSLFLVQLDGDLTEGYFVKAWPL